MRDERFETEDYIVFKLRFGNWFLYEKETDNEIAESKKERRKNDNRIAR